MVKPNRKKVKRTLKLKRGGAPALFTLNPDINPKSRFAGLLGKGKIKGKSGSTEIITSHKNIPMYNILKSFIVYSSENAFVYMITSDNLKYNLFVDLFNGELSSQQEKEYNKLIQEELFNVFPELDQIALMTEGGHYNYFSSKTDKSKKSGKEKGKRRKSKTKKKDTTPTSSSSNSAAAAAGGGNKRKPSPKAYSTPIDKEGKKKTTTANNDNITPSSAIEDKGVDIEKELRYLYRYVYIGIYLKALIVELLYDNKDNFLVVKSRSSSRKSKTLSNEMKKLKSLAYDVYDFYRVSDTSSSRYSSRYNLDTRIKKIDEFKKKLDEVDDLTKEEKGKLYENYLTNLEREDFHYSSKTSTGYFSKTGKGYFAKKYYDDIRYALPFHSSVFSMVYEINIDFQALAKLIEHSDTLSGFLTINNFIDVSVINSIDKFEEFFKTLNEGIELFKNQDTFIDDKKDGNNSSSLSPLKEVK